MSQITIQLNGKPESLVSESLKDLLTKHNVKIGQVAVAVNNTVIPVSQIESTTLNADDQVEIVQAVCGG